MKSIKSYIKSWLGMDKFEDYMERTYDRLSNVHHDLDRVNKGLREVADSAIIGADLGYREESQVIIIKFSRKDNSFKVIADTTYNAGSYPQFVRTLRDTVRKYNAEIIALDQLQTMQQLDLRSRILPDKRLIDSLKPFDKDWMK